MEKTKQISFVADAETIELINALKKELKANTTTAVFRKALAIAKVATELGGDSGVVTVKGRGRPASDEVSIALRA